MPINTINISPHLSLDLLIQVFVVFEGLSLWALRPEIKKTETFSIKTDLNNLSERYKSFWILALLFVYDVTSRIAPLFKYAIPVFVFLFFTSAWLRDITIFYNNYSEIILLLVSIYVLFRLIINGLLIYSMYYLNTQLQIQSNKPKEFTHENTVPPPPKSRKKPQITAKT